MRLTDRQTDRRTDRILIARPRLHCMQRGKKNFWSACDDRILQTRRLCDKQSKETAQSEVSKSASRPSGDCSASNDWRERPLGNHTSDAQLSVRPQRVATVRQCPLKADLCYYVRFMAT